MAECDGDYILPIYFIAEYDCRSLGDIINIDMFAVMCMDKG